MTTSAVLCAVRRIREAIARGLYYLKRDTVAVYGGNDILISFDDPHGKALYLKSEFKHAPKSQIIMFDSDEENLRFYGEHRDALKDRRVYIGLRTGFYETAAHDANVTFFNINDAIARDVWEKIALWKRKPPRVTVTILGSGDLGQCVLNRGLLMNLYSVGRRSGCGQEIVYNFVGNDRSYKISHADFLTFNKDVIRYYSAADDKIPDIIGNSDIVIACAELSVQHIRTLSAICGGELYCYSPNDDALQLSEFSDTVFFGLDSSIRTDENIRRHKLVRNAIARNHQYLVTSGKADPLLSAEEEWQKLSGFLKWSNVSSADFQNVLTSLCCDGANDVEELAELEHIRWCRFYTLNHWKYGVPDDPNMSNDPAHKIHKCLTAFSELSEDIREYDYATVREAMRTAADSRG